VERHAARSGYVDLTHTILPRLFGQDTRRRASTST
jgi:hypothetical protein